MTPESATIAGALIQAITLVVVSVFSIVITHYITIWRLRRRKIIEYTVSSTSLLESGRMAKSPLSVSVDKSILTRQAIDKGVSIAIHNAYAFIINLRNIGIETIEQPVIEIIFDGRAAIIQYETTPYSHPGYQITKYEDKKLNVLRFSVPYINSVSELLISVISVENTDSRCSVNVFSPGVRIQVKKDEQDDNSNRSRFTRIFLVSSIIIAFVTMATTVSSFIQLQQQLQQQEQQLQQQEQQLQQQEQQQLIEQFQKQILAQATQLSIQLTQTSFLEKTVFSVQRTSDIDEKTTPVSSVTDTPIGLPTFSPVQRTPTPTP